MSGYSAHLRRFLSITAACSALLAPCAANAQQVTATNSVYSFSSPNGAFGPWTIQTLRYQVDWGKDVPSITLFRRDDEDKGVHSLAQAIYVDDYHVWSPRFYTYAQASLANGSINPYRMIYVEADGKIDPAMRLVMALGGAQMQNPDGTTTRYVSAGPSYYSGSMVYTVRFAPANTNGINTSATQFIAQWNALGRNQVTLEFQDGSQPSVLLGLPPSFTTYQRFFETDVTVDHWIAPGFGVIVGGTIGNHFDLATGNRIYNQHAVTIGLFFGRTPGLPH